MAPDDDVKMTVASHTYPAFVGWEEVPGTFGSILVTGESFGRPLRCSHLCFHGRLSVDTATETFWEGHYSRRADDPETGSYSSSPSHSPNGEG